MTKILMDTFCLESDNNVTDFPLFKLQMLIVTSSSSYSQPKAVYSYILFKVVVTKHHQAYHRNRKHLGKNEYLHHKNTTLHSLNH